MKALVSAVLLLILGAMLMALRPSLGSEDRHELILTSDCGAKGDGKTDDSLALKQCLERLQSQLMQGHPTVLTVPAGFYRITGVNGEMPTIRWRGGTIKGDGPHASYIILDESYRGALFSWSEAWTGNNFGASYDPTKDASGPTVTGLQIIGSLQAKADQNAFVFYDRADHVLMRDIEVINMKGSCLSIGQPKFMPVAYMREAMFENIKCWGTGTSSLPAISISSVSRPNSDATNEIDLYKLAVFNSASDGVAISNPNKFSATRSIRFFGLRIEKCAGDALIIGAKRDSGQVANIEVYSLSVIQADVNAVHIGAGKAAPGPYQVSVHGGSLNPGNHHAIRVDAGRLIEINLSYVDSPIELGAAVGDDINIHGNGNERAWKIIKLMPSAQ